MKSVNKDHNIFFILKIPNLEESKVVHIKNKYILNVKINPKQSNIFHLNSICQYLIF